MALLYQVAKVAETFHVLPSVAARDLDEDPEQLSIVCLSLLNYGAAHEAYRSAKRARIDEWRKTSAGARLMDLVTEIDLAIIGAEADAREGG